jgi:hypothetical protein
MKATRVVQKWHKKTQTNGEKNLENWFRMTDLLANKPSIIFMSTEIKIADTHA